MSQIYPSFLAALGKVEADGTEVKAWGGTITKVPATTGEYDLSLDQPLDASECVINASAYSTTGSFTYSVEDIDDQTKRIRWFAAQCCDVATEPPPAPFVASDVAFGWTVFQFPQT